VRSLVDNALPTIVLVASAAEIPMTHEELSAAILFDLLQDFRNRGLNANALSEGYEGLSLAGLHEKYCPASATNVDFDLALKELEDAENIRTGPIEVTSEPGLLLSFSKREYGFLTEKGYKTAQKPQAGPKSRFPSPTVHISGGTFHHSPIGVGHNFTQSINIDASHRSEAVTQLLQLLRDNGGTLRPDTEQWVVHLVDVTQQGNLAAAKPIFHELFSTAAEGVKTVAWGVITALISHQMGWS